MKHCVIAVRVNRSYRSIICHYDDCSDVARVLRKKYRSIRDITHLLELGDLNHLDETSISAFHRDWGYLWNETTPVIHDDLKLLISYSDAIGADRLHVFEDNAWEHLVINYVDDELLSA